MRISTWAILGMLAAFYVAALIFYPQMPAQMASHWNARGQVNGYISRFWGVFLFPFMATALTLLFLAIPNIDPLKTNIAKFRSYFDWFVILFLVYFLYIYLLTILWNKGVKFDLLQAMLPAIGALFFFAGVMMRHARRNYLIGIRTPWTLANDEVWNRTHRLGGILFMACGAIIAIASFWPKYAVYAILVPVLLVTLITVVYSYVIYQRIVKPG
jgi:immunity protein, SdpI family